MAALRNPYAVLSPLVYARGTITFAEYMEGKTYTIREESDDGLVAEHLGCRLRYVGDDLCFDRENCASGITTYHGKEIPHIFEP